MEKTFEKQKRRKLDFIGKNRFTNKAGYFKEALERLMKTRAKELSSEEKQAYNHYINESDHWIKTLKKK